MHFHVLQAKISEILKSNLTQALYGLKVFSLGKTISLSPHLKYDDSNNDPTYKVNVRIVRNV